MVNYLSTVGLDQPAVYEIRIQGRSENDLAEWFIGEVVRRVESAEPGVSITVLTGTVLDQAALHELLNHIGGLGLALLYVDCLSAHELAQDSEILGSLDEER